MAWTLRNLQSVACAALLLGAPVARAGPEPEASLPIVLERLARAAGLYRDAALEFTCDETIHFAGVRDPEVQRYRYIYRYDAERGLDDHRVPRGVAAHRSSAAQRRAAADDLGLPAFLTRAYSWQFVFGDLQPLYRFALLEPERVEGRQVVRVAFSPRPPYREGFNDWHGSAWIDTRSWQLLRVEAVRADEAAAYERWREQREIALDTDRAFTFTLYTTEFDVRKNGMRFPGRVVIRRALHRLVAAGPAPTEHETPIFRVTQVYRRYRFFSVRTAAEVRAIVLGE